MTTRLQLPADVDRSRLTEALLAVDGVTDAAFGERTALLVGAPRGPPLWPLGPAVGRRLTLPVRFDGPDLALAAAAVGESPEGLVRQLVAAPLEVRFLGFVPGFAYLALPDGLVVPRRATPRPRVPVGSFAVGGPYAGVYPSATPGGWSLLGTALVDVGLLGWRPGDRVDVVSADGPDPAASPEVAFRADGDALEILRLAGVATVQDRGRPGRLHQGMPSGGPLDPAAMAAANRAVGNRDDDAAIELLGGMTVRAPGRALATAGTCAVGELVVPPSPDLRYVAVGGGLDGPTFHGAQGAAPSLGLSRPLRRGDRLAVGPDPGRAPQMPERRDPRAPRLVVGPDPVDGVLDALLDATFTRGPASDRTGIRLVGPRLTSGVALGTSEPMVKGGVELLPDGTAVLLGPDHPVTGGYPLVAQADAVGWWASWRFRR